MRTSASRSERGSPPGLAWRRSRPGSRRAAPAGRPGGPAPRRRRPRRGTGRAAPARSARSRRVTGPPSWRPCPTTTRVVGTRSSTDGELPGELEPHRDRRPASSPSARTAATPCVTAADRLHASRPAPARARSRRPAQRSVITWAPRSPSGPRAYAAAPSSIQACSSQAMLSGARSSAPRWSVVGLTGIGDAVLVGEQLAAAARRRPRRSTARSSSPAKARRQQQHERPRPGPRRRRTHRRPPARPARSPPRP